MKLVQENYRIQVLHVAIFPHHFWSSYDFVIKVRMFFLIK